MIRYAMDERWRSAALRDHGPQGRAPVPAQGDASVERLDALLRAWSVGFADRRDDVESATLTIGTRGLHPDEASAFVRALDGRLLHVDSAGVRHAAGREDQDGWWTLRLAARTETGQASTSSTSSSSPRRVIWSRPRVAGRVSANGAWRFRPHWLSRSRQP